MTDIKDNQIENDSPLIRKRREVAKEYFNPYEHLKREERAEIKLKKSQPDKLIYDDFKIVADGDRYYRSINNTNPREPESIECKHDKQEWIDRDYRDNWGGVSKIIFNWVSLARKRIVEYFFQDKKKSSQSYYKTTEYINKDVFNKNNQKMTHNKE